MPSHFSAIGFSVQSDDELMHLAEQIADIGKHVQVDNGYYLRWSSGNGAEVWLQMSIQGECIGITPYFEGKSAFRAMITADIVRADDTVLEGAVHCWANPLNNQPDTGEYPFVFDVVDSGRCRKLAYPFPSSLKLCGFAHELSAYQSAQAYEDHDPGQLKFACESFVPSGLFSPDGKAINPPMSEAIFTGYVLETSLLTNPLSGNPFHWALVQTLGGQIDVVCDPLLVKAPILKGGIVSGAFWLCGRIQEPRHRGLFQRLFGRKA